MQGAVLKRAVRISEINREISQILPKFWQEGMETQGARVDGRVWAERLGPLLDEHQKLKLEISTLLAGGN